VLVRAFVSGWASGLAIAFRHFAEIVLVQEFACFAFFAEASHPVFAYQAVKIVWSAGVVLEIWL
jgi:hypothetical protein